MKDAITYVLKNLKNRKLRSYLTIIGIVIGIDPTNEASVHDTRILVELINE